MTITLNGTTGITTPAIDNQGNLTVSGALNTTGLSASTAGLLTVPSGASIYTVGSGTFGLNVAGELTIASGRDNGGDTIVKTSNTERMRIDGAGRVTMPYQPSFEAQSVTNQNLTNSWSNLIFDSVLSNRGGHYNGTNGRFTAPVFGFYQFNTAFLVSKANNTRLDAIIVKNGVNYSAAEYQDYSTTPCNTSIVYTSCVQLATGDYVNIGSAAHGGSGAYFYGIASLTRFSGHLIG